MGAGNDILAALVRLQNSVDALTAKVDALASRGPSSSGGVGGAIASDSDLDSQYGDPETRFDPRDWSGPSYKRERFSACPPDYLDMLAAVLDDFAAKETDDKKRGYKLKDAARARGWAARKRRQQEVEGDL